MNAERLIGAEASVALAGVIAGDLISQTDRTLPAPRRILAIFGFYGLLSLMAALGSGPARLASAMGAVTALASIVLGATGRTIVDVITRATGLLTRAGAGTSSAAAGPSTAAYYGQPAGPPTGGRVGSPTTAGGYV